jgi:1-acyl-sn-glycerol-3-phosphate acyltransferase
MTVGLLLFALMCLASIPLFSIFWLAFPKSRRQHLVRESIRVGFRAYLVVLRRVCGISCDARELDAVRSDGPLIFVANHPSLLDAVILMSRMPNATCIMKSLLLRNPLYAVASRMAGYVSNANAEQMLGCSRAELARGSHFIFFPEGGRTREFPVSPFSSSCILLARLTNTPIQTVFMDYSSPYLGKHWGLFSRPALPLRVHARLGKRIAPVELRSDALRSLEGYFRSQVRANWL